jgi:hypothetical protein
VPQRKLAVIIWNMAVKGVEYINPEGYLFLCRLPFFLNQSKLGEAYLSLPHLKTFATGLPR